MNIKIKLFLTLLVLAVFSACRNDEYRFGEPLNGEPLVKESMVANLIKRTTLKDGSFDNIIDSASCITVKLPVQLMVNGNQVTINTVDDYEIIASIFSESDTDTDTLTITYPITIILEDFTEVSVNSKSELNIYRNECDDEDEEDDDIECIDFDYPILVTTYNTLTDKLDAVSIDSDKALYEFIEEIEDYLIVNINFPITLTLYDGTFVSINNLDDLQLAIEDVINACDEDDDFDFEDDDHHSTETEESFKALIAQCPLKIYELVVSGQHQEAQFSGFEFEFNSDGSAIATNGSSTVYQGSWYVSLDTGLRLTIGFDDFSIIRHTWRLKEINPEDNGTQIDLQFGEDEMKLKQACP
ncbi:hypothetical protein WJN01_06565 [Flavobacteriaceae bacterium SZ-1-7]|uniref:hypothetical protein n=1 Tax=Tamlana sedimenti TaxID=3134126 RepID=UPI003129BF7A